MKYIFIILFSIPFFSCSNKKIIDKTKFVKVYTDIVIAQDTVPMNKPVFDSVKQAVFKRYGVTSEQYDSTVSHYNKDVSRWQNFFTLVSAHIDSLRSKKKITRGNVKGEKTVQ
jgi:hypothetical protein